MLPVGAAFHAELATGVKLRADAAVAEFACQPESWQIRAMAGPKGARRYAGAWISTISERHSLLIRKHLTTSELAYHYCYIPTKKPINVTTLVRVACLRWPVEEDFEFGKDHFGLDHSHVRRHTALNRHLVLTLAVLAVCAVTVAQARTRAPAAILPTSSDESPPADPGLIATTVAEIKRLFSLATRRLHTEAHHLHWTVWRKRHQARARWLHHRARLRRQAALHA